MGLGLNNKELVVWAVSLVVLLALAIWGLSMAVDAGGQLFIELAYESNAKRICIEMEYPEMEYIRDEEGHAQYFCARLVDGTSEILDITENVWRQTNGK